MPLTRDKLRHTLPMLQQAAWHTVVPLDGTQYCATSPTPTSRPSSIAPDGWQPLNRGEMWGAPLQTVWLRQSLQLPPDLQDQPVWLHLRWRGDAHQWSPDVIEAQVFVDDTPLAGLDAEHRLVLLPVHPAGGDIFVRAHVNQTQPFGGLELVVLDEPTNQLAHTFRVVLDTLEVLAAHALASSRLLEHLNYAYQLLDLREGPAAPRFRSSVRQACDYLDQQLLAGIDGGTRPQMVVTGHAHIDVAWLWPLWRTRQKTVHTFSTVLQLMEQDPDYHFTASTPQLYQFVKEDAPELYAQIRQRVAEGRWEPIGGMWIEADCNIPSGESLVRQFVHGMRFFAAEFGVRDRVLWLPDVFGYSAALPQILHGVGIDTFMTTKISWSQFNRMPVDTFRWRGIDGSDVLTHFVTVPDANQRYYTYNGTMTPADVAGTWREYRQQAINDELLYLMGYGDGGGGPTMEQLQTVRRLHDMPGMPQVRFGSANDYFARLHQRVDGNPKLPVWVGELYLEYHRGTYTSQAWIKQANRRAEQLYHDAEFLDAWAASAGDYISQRELLNQGWQLLLLNQFHDILPGTSISNVYSEAKQQYAEIMRIGQQVRDAALATLGAANGAPVVVNTLGWTRSDPLLVPAEWATDLAHTGLPTQPVAGLDGAASLLVDGASVPGYGMLDLAQATPSEHAGALSITCERLENAFFRLDLDANGEIASLYDKQHARDIVVAGQRANQIVAFEDRPLNYDAWDIDHYYEEKPYPIQEVERIEIVEHGPIRGGVEVVKRFLGSTLRQRILIYQNLPRIDFETEIDWHEHQIVVKAAFPLNINTARATHEIQFGAVERSTHRNTSWDMARFETCAQRWVDLSEGEYGVALLNDSKYGYDVHDHVLRLTLLKSGIFPDPNADQGMHRFTYALLPHAGDWQAGQVVRHAAQLNAPALVASKGAREALPAPLVQCDAAHVVLDTIKTAEEGDGLVVRLYEAHNQRGFVELTFAAPIERAERCNLLEEPIDQLDVDQQRVRFAIKPFEIVTLRVWLEQGSGA